MPKPTSVVYSLMDQEDVPVVTHFDAGVRVPLPVPENDGDHTRVKVLFEVLHREPKDPSVLFFVCGSQTFCVFICLPKKILFEKRERREET